MNRTFKLVLLLNVLGGAIVSSPLHADNIMPTLLNQFKSPDPDVRSVAFSSAVARPETEKKDAYQTAVIALLNTEITYSMATPIAELQDDDEWNAYYNNLIITVAKFRDSRAIPALLQVMDKNDEARQALASFGPRVADRILPNVNDLNQPIRLAAVTVLFEMLDPENEVNISDHALRNRIELALKSVDHDPNPNIKTTALEALNKLKTLKKRPESTYY